jgi:hypothetical protein
MTPEAFETALIAQIETLQLPVLPYPQDPKNYYPEHDPGEVLVRYEGRKILERDIAGQLSKVRLYAEIVVVTRQVREVGGAYDWLSRIYDALEGFTMDGAAGPLFMEVESFMDESKGLWQFGQKWSLTVNQAILLEDEYDSPLGDN